MVQNRPKSVGLLRIRVPIVLDENPTQGPLKTKLGESKFLTISPTKFKHGALEIRVQKF